MMSVLRFCQKTYKKTDQIFHQTQQNYFLHLDQKWCSWKIEYLYQNKVLNYDIWQSNTELAIETLPCQKIKIWLRNDNLRWNFLSHILLKLSNPTTMHLTSEQFSPWKSRTDEHSWHENNSLLLREHCLDCAHTEGWNAHLRHGHKLHFSAEFFVKIWCSWSSGVAMTIVIAFKQFPMFAWQVWSILQCICRCMEDCKAPHI